MLSLVILSKFFSGNSSSDRLNPRTQLKNPVMFITEVCALVTTIIAIRNGATGQNSFFEIQIFKSTLIRDRKNHNFEQLKIKSQFS